MLGLGGYQRWDALRQKTLGLHGRYSHEHAFAHAPGERGAGVGGRTGERRFGADGGEIWGGPRSSGRGWRRRIRWGEEPRMAWFVGAPLVGALARFH